MRSAGVAAAMVLAKVLPDVPTARELELAGSPYVVHCGGCGARYFAKSGTSRYLVCPCGCFVRLPT